MYIADLHIHSRYSRATSRDCTPESLDLWARRKGIGIVGTGDFTHPAWRQELREKLKPAGNGCYVLKEEYRIADDSAADGVQPQFVITGEISSIYKKYDRVRKVHSLILLPGLEEAELVSGRLETIGNLHSDGRPILGLDCHDLLEILLELCPEAVYVPAHIWTPHFSLFGAFSGFDSVEECYGDLSRYICAMETGLSSDPLMNGRVSALDRYQLISNSDAHSPAKLGREANLLEIELSYMALQKAIRTGEGLTGTIEFFPEEGKYHYDGHRKCGICLSPAETEAYKGICPVCGRKLTIGVSHRIEQLSDRPVGYRRENGVGFESLIPLPELIGAALGCSPASVKAEKMYRTMLQKLGAEFPILREIPVEEIRGVAGTRIAEGIGRLRGGEVTWNPGFDGEYGTFYLFTRSELHDADGQLSLFEQPEMKRADHTQNDDGQPCPQETPGQPGDTTNAECQVGAHAAPGPPAPSADPAAESAPGFAPASGLPAPSADPAAESAPGFAAESGPPAPSAAHPPQTARTADRRLTSAADRPAPESRPKLLWNEKQRQAIESVGRVTIVTAGPGTGKTGTLAAHILHLIRVRRVKPSSIAAVTFTGQAAKELRERIESQLGKATARRLTIGTFHSIAWKILTDSGMEVSLAGETQTRELVRNIRAEYGLKQSVSRLLTEISNSRTGMHTPESDQEKAVLEAYQNSLREWGALDYDDILLEALRIAETKPDGSETKPDGSETKPDEFGKRNDAGNTAPQKGAKAGAFPYLLADEFQDISPLQYRLIRAWNRDGRELFVIGDRDQAIYGFRGADAGCFETLRQDAPEACEIRLLENYRSTPQILSAAGAVIANNPGPARLLHANRPAGAPVRIIEAESDRAEAVFAAKEINRLTGGIGMLEAQELFWAGGERTFGFGDIAVCYRTHRQAALLEECLKKEGIPCVVTGREEFLQEETVRGTICFIRSLLYPNDRMAAKTARMLLWQKESETLAESSFAAMTEKYAPGFLRKKPQKFLEEWMREPGLEQKKEMQLLHQTAMCYSKMTDFSEALETGTESELKRCGGKRYTADAVTLMTLHGSKGLEFPVVLICGVKKGCIPFTAANISSDEQEERRLFYVGLTRAKEELIVTYAKEPSGFLAEIPGETAVREKAPAGKSREYGRQMSLFELL